MSFLTRAPAGIFRDGATPGSELPTQLFEKSARRLALLSDWVAFAALSIGVGFFVFPAALPVPGGVAAASFAVALVTSVWARRAAARGERRGRPRRSAPRTPSTCTTSAARSTAPSTT